MTVPTYVWILPRPRRDAYPGSWPLHFETKLLRLLNYPAPTLQQFAGMAEHGVRLDMRRTHPMADHPNLVWRPPDVQGDAGHLPFKDNVFGLVIADPPYSPDDAKKLYGTPPVRYVDYIREAVRVTRPGGLIASYHVVMTPRPAGTTYHSRILLGGRPWHRLRACCIFQKGDNR